MKKCYFALLILLNIAGFSGCAKENLSGTVGNGEAGNPLLMASNRSDGNNTVKFQWSSEGACCAEFELKNPQTGDVLAHYTWETGEKSGNVSTEIAADQEVVGTLRTKKYGDAGEQTLNWDCKIIRSETGEITIDNHGQVQVVDVAYASGDPSKPPIVHQQNADTR